MTVVRFQVLFSLLVALLLRDEGVNVNGLSTNRGPTFSISEQALFGGYSNGEASLFGGAGSMMYGGQQQQPTMWKGNKKNSETESRPKVPFSGDRVESMTFFVPKNVHNKSNGSSQSSFVSGK